VSLVNVYMQAEEWDKAIAALEVVAPLTSKTVQAIPSSSSAAISQGQVDKAEAALATIEKTVGPRALASSRMDIALQKRLFDEVLANIESSYDERVREAVPMAITPRAATFFGSPTTSPAPKRLFGRPSRKPARRSRRSGRPTSRPYPSRKARSARRWPRPGRDWR